MPTAEAAPSNLSLSSQALPSAPAKPDLRRRARAARAAVHAVAAGSAAQAVRDRFLDAVPVPEAALIAGYWPVGSELDPRPLLDRLAQAGHRLGLPVVAPSPAGLVFRRWDRDTVLEMGAHAISVPPAAAEAIEPDLLLVPLLAFDRSGGRLGSGAGYYDRALAAARGRRKVVAVGLAFAAQEAPSLPREPHDQLLDWVVTERAAIRLG